VPNILSDPSLSLYLVLAVTFVIALAVWYRRRDRKTLLAALALGLLVLGLYLVDVSFESPREQANRRVQLMAVAATARDPERFVEQLSDSFNYRGVTKQQMRTSGIWATLRNFNARVAVWGFGKGEFEEIGENEIEIGFYAKGESPQGFRWYFMRARFVRDTDGQFRAKTVKFYAPEGGRTNEDPPPGFP
jgi:hypothetical protein